MAGAMMKKVEILEGHVVVQLFTMPEELIMTLEVLEYLLLHRCEELQRFWHKMGTLHISHDAIVVDTINNIVAPLALHPHVESTNPFHASQSTKKNQIVEIVHAFDVSCNMHQTLGPYTTSMVDAIWNLDRSLECKFENLEQFGIESSKIKFYFKKSLKL
jgi:hypothetical protein